MRVVGGIQRWVARARHHTIPIVEMRPADVREANLQLVLGRLAKAGVAASVIRGKRATRTFVAVGHEHREAAVRALAAGNSAPHLRVQMLTTANVDGSPSAPRSSPLASLADIDIPADLAVLRVFGWHVATTGSLTYGPQYGCDVEFWPANKNGWRVAPRANGVASQLAPDLFAPVSVEIEGRTLPMARGVHERATIDDITFPIDAVYLWVDAHDPVWQERRRVALAQDENGGEHGEIPAITDTPGIDELRFSLRSLDMYAPWFRRIYLITDQQVPSSLIPDDRLIVVDHRDIVDRPDRLPVFDSEPLVTWLHRIDGLAEHVVYMNDDLFFGRDVLPDTFFTAAGQVRVFPSAGVRPLGPVTAVDSLAETKAKRVADLVEARHGRRASRVVRQTPHALTKSLMTRIEADFAEEVELTRRQRVRGTDGVPVELIAHHVSQISGEGVRSPLAYGYANVTTAVGMAALREIAASRRHDVFCVNDAPVAEPQPVPVGEVRALLERMFPVRSRWEI